MNIFLNLRIRKWRGNLEMPGEHFECPNFPSKTHSKSQLIETIFSLFFPAPKSFSLDFFVDGDPV